MFFSKRTQLLDEEAAKHFESSDVMSFKKGHKIMIERLLPALTCLMDSSDEKDLIAAEKFRGKWFAFVGLADMPSEFTMLFFTIVMCATC